jgi:hypothetical protein
MQRERSISLEGTRMLKKFLVLNMKGNRETKNPAKQTLKWPHGSSPGSVNEKQCLAENAWSNFFTKGLATFYNVDGG